MLVAVIFLVVLGITLRKAHDIEIRESIDIRQFLEGAASYTSDCALSYEPNYASLGELLNACNEGKFCVRGEDTCFTLERTWKEVLDSSWQVGTERAFKGYVFNISFAINASSNDEKEILSLTKGNCSARFSGAEYIVPAFPRGIIISEMRVCN